MATSDSNLTRNELISVAASKIGQSFGSTGITNAAKRLNLIIREESAAGTHLARHLWAISSASLTLSANRWQYDAGATDAFEQDVLELVTVHYRNTSGDDTPVSIITRNKYEDIVDKNETGDVERVYIERNKNLSSNRLYVWPSPTSIGTTSTITGTDSTDYQCILAHTSSTNDKPITGNNWRMYWRQHGSSGSTWVTSTAYTAGETLIYTYKRPLYDFDASTDNPDMPQGWTRYLVWALALDLCPEFNITAEHTQMIMQFKDRAKFDMFPSEQPDTNSYHNSGVYF